MGSNDVGGRCRNSKKNRSSSFSSLSQSSSHDVGAGDGGFEGGNEVDGIPVGITVGKGEG